jgi:hypothetical protein
MHGRHEKLIENYGPKTKREGTSWENVAKT